MATLIKYTAFEPVVTGTLLWVLTRGSPDLRARVLRPLSSLPFEVEASTAIKTVKWLFAVGILSRINGWLNRLALNNWKIPGHDGGRPWNWPTEIAAVTGGSGGIGTEVIKRLADKGVKVAIMDVQPPGPALEAYRNVYFYECDVTNPESVSAAAAKIKADIGAPTILFNNAGIGKTADVLDISNDYLEKIFHINIMSHWYTVKAFLPDMIAGKKGHIVATASMASFVQVAGMVDYCVTKAAVMSFQEGLRQELKHRYNAPFIKTTSIHPYWVQTALLDPWRDTLKAIKNPIMTPAFVGGKIAEAILSGESQQVVLPSHMTIAAGVRAFSHWFQELVRDTTKLVTTKTDKA